MNVPWPALSLGLLPYAMLFGLMLLGNAYVLLRLFPRDRTTPDLATVTFLIGILLMSLGLWGALIYAFLSPGDASTVSVFIALNSMMGVVGCWAIAVFLRGEAKSLPRDGLRWPLLLAALVIGNELLMGVAFALGIAGTPAYYATGGSGTVGLAIDGALGIWFPLAMFANMTFAVLWIPGPRPDRLLLGLFGSSSLVVPWLTAAPVAGAIAMSAWMGAAVALLGRQVRAGAVDRGYLRLTAGVWAGFAAMSVGAVAIVLDPSGLGGPAALAGIVTLAMGAEMVVLIARGLGGSVPVLPSAGLAGSPSPGEPAPSPSTPRGSPGGGWSPSAPSAGPTPPAGP